MNELQQDLITTGDFLTLTRENQYSLPSFSFEVTHELSNSKSKVTILDTGIIVFEPLTHVSTKDIVLSSAVHGNETAPIEICARLIKQIILGELHLEARVLFLFGNPASINISERFVEENLNRLFSGGHSADQGQGEGLINKERYRALLLENVVRDFFEQGCIISTESGIARQRFHYDLHTAIRGSKNDKFAVYPFRHGKPWKKEQLQFLLSCGVNTILLSHSPTTTFSYYSSNEFGADAFTVELGQVKPFGENDMNNFVGVSLTLKRFISGEDLQLKDYDVQDFSIFEIFQTINRTGKNFQLHFADDVENFTDFPLDYLLATDDEIEHRVKKMGEAIIFPNADVAIGQRAMLTVIPTSID